MGIALHETLRYPKPEHSIAESPMEDYRSFFDVTRWPNWPGLTGAGRAQLERGIDAVTSVAAPDGTRRPAVLIGINPHKAGSDWTPWHDEIDPRHGFVRYYGDNKPTLGVDPALTPGNKALIAQHELHASASADERLRAAPLLFFENVIQLGRSKGYRRFRGVGLLDRVERVVQVDSHAVPFVNFRYDCMLVKLADENNVLDWDWIAARRDPTKSLPEATRFAPKAWRQWIASGRTALEAVRQRLLTYRIVSEVDQLPQPGSPAEGTLSAILDFYASQPKRFEALAERVAQAALGPDGSYRMGWLTRGSGDRGIDFVGRIDLGIGSEPLKVVVAGQAKCQRGASGVADLSRLASKLNRGWVGVFITTGHFSLFAQRELQDDGFPILLINGRRLADIVLAETIRLGVEPIDYLRTVDASYEGRIKAREPSEILSDE